MNWKSPSQFLAASAYFGFEFTFSLKSCIHSSLGNFAMLIPSLSQ